MNSVRVHPQQSKQQSENDSAHNRTKILLLILVFLFLGVVGRLFYWQVLHRSTLQAQAENQYTRTVPVSAHRGKIFTSDGYMLVDNAKVYRLFAEPNVLKEDPAMIASALAPLLVNLTPAPAPVPTPAVSSSGSTMLATSSATPLPLPALTPAQIARATAQQIESIRQDVLAKLSDKNSKWVALKNKIDEQTKQKIDDLHIHGLGFDEYEVRDYPEASMAAQVTGFVGKDKDGNDQGYFGVEGALDRELKGRAQQQSFLKDALGFHLLFDQQTQPQQTDGRDVVLTIRRDMQFAVEDLLQKGIEKYGAASGEVLVMEPSTGKILAMASWPSYDQAHFQDFDPSLYKNPSLTDTYEPGSIFKVLTVAAGVDSKVIDENTTCTSCASARQIGQYTIKTWNDQYHPDITMNDALAKSDNVAMIFISELLGKDRFLEYVHKFGIGDEAHIDLQEDTGTPLRKDKDWKTIDLATGSFGQGIVTNGVQMVRAVGAIANHGTMMRPTIIEKVTDPTQGTDSISTPVVERQVVSSTTADTVSKMMIYAAETGEAKWVASKHYLVAAKTGTAQVPIGGHYDDTRTIASFIGFAPADNPKFVMLVKLHEPKTSPWAAETAAPLWYEIANRLFLLLNVPQER
jgi:cell division protein FtsI/penicillin-binding protein 2